MRTAILLILTLCLFQLILPSHEILERRIDWNNVDAIIDRELPATALGIACYQNDTWSDEMIEIIEKLIEKKADVNKVCHAETGVPLNLVAMWDNRSDKCRVFELLLKAGALATWSHPYNQKTALHTLANQSNEHAWLERQLYSSTLVNHPAVLLHKYGANLDAQDHKGNTALHDAAKNENTALIHLLLYLGASPTIKNRQNRMTALSSINLDMPKINLKRPQEHYWPANNRERAFIVLLHQALKPEFYAPDSRLKNDPECQKIILAYLRYCFKSHNCGVKYPGIQANFVGLLFGKNNQSSNLFLNNEAFATITLYAAEELARESMAMVHIDTTPSPCKQK